MRTEATCPYYWLFAKAVIDKSEISKLLRGDLERFSIERLMKALRELGAPIRITWVDEVVISPLPQ